MTFSIREPPVLITMAFSVREPPVLVTMAFAIIRETSVPYVEYFGVRESWVLVFRELSIPVVKVVWNRQLWFFESCITQFVHLPPPLIFFREPEVLIKDQGKHPLVMKVVISFPTRTQFFHWFLREGEGEGAGLWRALLTAMITAGVYSGFLRTAHRRCKLCTLLQRDCAVDGEREEEAPFLSLPVAAAIFKMPSISWAFAS